MDFVRNFPLFTIILSLFSSALSAMLKGKKARNLTITHEGLLISLNSVTLCLTYINGAFTYSMGEFPAPWGNEIRAGILEAMIALLFSIVLFASVTAGWKFLKIDIDESKINLYYSLINLLTAALMALVWTNDIFTGYVFLEILTLTSCGILIVREIGRTTLAAVRYMILNLMGSGLFLLGVVLLYNISGHLLMVPMHESLIEVSQNPDGLRVISLTTGILTIGLAIKSGLFPFHFWMPDTYGWATPTSASILSSLVSKGYIFLLIKIYCRSIGLDIIAQTGVENILFVLGICGIIFGSFSALHAGNIDRMVAFSSAAQIGYIYMGIGMGTVAGLTSAIFQILCHAVTKSLLFLSTPYLAEVSGNSLLFKNLQGSAHKAKIPGIFFTIAAFSMIGVPIFAGFSMKVIFAGAAVEYGGLKMIAVMLALALSSLLNVMYFMRTIVRIYTRNNTDEFTEPIASDQNEEETDTFSFISAGILLTFVNIFLGLFSWISVELIIKGLSMFA